MNEAPEQPPGDFDPGIVPWTFACLAWVFVPGLPLTLGLGCFAPTWAGLAGTALLFASVLALTSLARRRRPSEFTWRALVSVSWQVALVAIAVAILVLLRG